MLNFECRSKKLNLEKNYEKGENIDILFAQGIKAAYDILATRAL
jgi:hypothetical protein